MKYEADVHVRRDDEPDAELVDGKSIMQLMMLAATKGTVLVISAAGGDANDALADLVRTVESGFSED